MLCQIRSTYDDEHILYSTEADSLSQVMTKVRKERDSRLLGALLSYMDLSDVDLAYFNMAGANLSCTKATSAQFNNANLHRTCFLQADLTRACFRYAVMDNADFSYADLSHADLSFTLTKNASFYGANLHGAKINWNSHQLLSELLRKAAGRDARRRMIAGLVTVSPDWCWKDFLSIGHELREWAFKTLAKYVTVGDNSPAILKQYV